MTRVAQVLLAAAGLALWASSRLTWIDVVSFDGLPHPRTTAVSGGTWSSALVPLAALVLAAALATLAVRGWPMRVLAALLALCSAGMGYLGIGLWAIRDVAVRAANVAEVPVAALVDTERHYLGATLCLGAALCTLIAAVLLLRTARAGAGAGKYAAPAARRAAAEEATSGDLSERMIWDALDEGHDPTRGTDDNEGR